MVYIVFIRGINVGGKTKVSMSIIKDELVKAGILSAKTLLNSGNIIVGTNYESNQVEKIFQSIIKNNFELEPQLMIYTLNELKTIIESDPFEKQFSDLSKKCVALTSSQNTNITEDNKSLTANNKSMNVENLNWANNYDELIFKIENTLYIYFVNGQGRSKLNAATIEKITGRAVTLRNWNTILKAYNIAMEVSHEA